MRLLAVCLVAGLVMLLTARAHADWRTDLSVAGTPNNVLDVWGPGKFSVGYEQGAYLYLDGVAQPPLTNITVGTLSVGTYYEPGGCFILINSHGERYRSAAGGGTCTLDYAHFFSGITTSVVRVKHAPGGGAVAVSYADGEDPRVFVTDAGIYDAPQKFILIDNPADTFKGEPGVVRVGDKLFSLAGSLNGFYWYEDTKRAVFTGHSYPGYPPVGFVQAIDLFAAGSPVNPHAVAATRFALLQGPFDQSTKMSDIKPVWMLDVGTDYATSTGVTGVSINVDGGVGSYGHGFGMAVVGLPDGGHAMLSPVPMPDATQAGTLWRYRPIPADMAAAPLNQVACTSSSYCVVTASKPSSGNLFIYTNGEPPRYPAGTSVTLDEGQSREFTFEASDLDGDPVLMLASPPAQSGAQWSVQQVDKGADGGWLPGDPLVMNVTVGAVCQDQQVGSFKLRASDGLAAHDVEQDIPIHVNHTRRPDVPALDRSKSGLIAGEQEPLLVRVREPYAGCRLTGFHWSAQPVGTGLVGPAMAQDGGSFATFTAPPTLCVAGGADFPFQLVVDDSEGLSSDPGVFQVHVAPWGKPNTAFETADGGVLIAGQTRELSPTPRTHECLDAGGFPGVETAWRVTSDRELSDGGIILQDLEGNPVEPGAEVRSPRLVAKTADCIDTTHLTFTAVNHLRGTPNDVASPPSEHHVVVETSLTPFDSGQLLLAPHPVEQPSGELSVEVDSTLNCPARRGLRADLQVSQPDGGARAVSGQVPIQGTWQVPLGEHCLGGRLRLSASMVDGDGRRSRETVMEVVAPPARAGVEPLPEDLVLETQCGQGASLELTPTFPSGFCQTPDVTWKQVAGPELELEQLPGLDGAVSLATKDTGLDALVGRSVVVEVTASASPENQSSLQHTLPITVKPFVKVRRRAEVPAASDTGLVGVSVELTNTTACDVNDVSYEERLEGLTYVEGSAQVDGQPVEASWRGDALSVKGLSLTGNGTRRLTYVARPHLVGTRGMWGEARLRDVTISISDKRGPSVEDSGCGCTSPGPGPVLFALGALVVAVRRRRR